MKRSLLLVILILSLLSLNAKIIEKKGNPKLKKLKSDNKDCYIGVSQKTETLQDAINSAFLHVQSQIIQNLGVKAVINLELENSVNDNSPVSISSFSLIQKNTVSGSYNLKIKQDEVYWEHHSEKEKDYFLAFVKVNFSINEYKKDLENKVSAFTEEIDCLDITDTQEHFKKLITVTRNTEIFEKEYSHLFPILNRQLIDEYKSNVNNNNTFFNNCLQNLSITYLNKDEKFPETCYFSVSLFKQDLKNFPLYFCSDITKPVITNNEGICSLKPEYFKFVRKIYSLSFLPNLETKSQLPVYNFTLISPLYNENLNISLQIHADLAKEELNQLFANALLSKKFILNSQKPDFIIKISASSSIDKKASNASYSVSNAVLVIKLIHAENQILIEEWKFPNNQFPSISACSRDSFEARKNAILLNGTSNKNELISYLMNEIEQSIKRKKWY